jgi:hypothetical protein
VADDYESLSFWERRRFDRAQKRLVTSEPLRERFPVYMKIFLLGWVGITVLAAAVVLFSDTGWAHAFGFTAIFTGVFLLLIGGARGGGYSNLGLGAVEALVGGRNRTDDDYERDDELRRGDVMKRRDPMARLRKGLRPPPNPAAFWQTVAGLVYIAAGIPFTL